MPKFDFAATGAGIGALAATALMCRNNGKTILLEPGNEAGGALTPVKKDGFVFYPGPALSYDLGTGGVFGRLCSALGLVPEAFKQAPCYQVALPDHRITVHRDHAGTIEELRREFPRELDAMAKFYREIRKSAERNAGSRLSAFFSRQQSARGFIQKYRFSREFGIFLDVQSRSFFQRPVKDLTLFQLIAMINTTPVIIGGGLQKLIDQLLSVIEKSGGTVRFNEPWPEPVLRKKRLVSIMTREGAVEAKTFCFNTETYSRAAELFIGLREEVVPVRMCRDVICLPDYTQPERFYTLSLGAPDDKASAPAGMRTLTASFRMAPDTRSNKDVLLDQVAALIPFLKDHLALTAEYLPEQRRYRFPPELAFKQAKGQTFLSRASSRNTWLIHDGFESPIEAVFAAQQLARKLT